MNGFAKEHGTEHMLRLWQNNQFKKIGKGYTVTDGFFKSASLDQFMSELTG